MWEISVSVGWRRESGCLRGGMLMAGSAMGFKVEGGRPSVPPSLHPSSLSPLCSLHPSLSPPPSLPSIPPSLLLHPLTGFHCQSHSCSFHASPPPTHNVLLPSLSTSISISIDPSNPHFQAFSFHHCTLLQLPHCEHCKGNCQVFILPRQGLFGKL